MSVSPFSCTLKPPVDRSFIDIKNLYLTFTAFARNSQNSVKFRKIREISSTQISWLHDQRSPSQCRSVLHRYQKSISNLSRVRQIFPKIPENFVKFVKFLLTNCTPLQCRPVDDSISLFSAHYDQTSNRCIRACEMGKLTRSTSKPTRGGVASRQERTYTERKSTSVNPNNDNNIRITVSL